MYNNCLMKDALRELSLNLYVKMDMVIDKKTGEVIDL